MEEVFKPMRWRDSEPTERGARLESLSETNAASTNAARRTATNHLTSHLLLNMEARKMSSVRKGIVLVPQAIQNENMKPSFTFLASALAATTIAAPVDVRTCVFNDQQVICDKALGSKYTAFHSDAS